MELHIQNLIDDDRCYDAVRRLRWGSEIKCAYCQSKHIVKRGRDDKEHSRQRYECKECSKRFDDLTHTVFAGHHQPLKVWMLFLYFLGLNLSTRQIAQELNLNKDDAQHMAEVLRSGVVERSRRLLCRVLWSAMKCMWLPVTKVSQRRSKKAP